MAKDVLIYLSFHEPSRLRIPIDPIPPGADIEQLRNCVFDSEATRYFYNRWLEEVCRPYANLLERLVADGAKFLINVSGPLLQMLADDRSDAAVDFLRLLRHPSISLVCADARNSISFYLDIDLFRQEMQKGRQLAAKVFDRLPELAVAPLTAINTEMYHVCKEFGFTGVIVDGCWDLLKGRASGQIYHSGSGPLLLTRNSDLSLKTAAMLTEQDQASYSIDSFPLASRIAEHPTDSLLLGWQVGGANGRTSHADECATLERFLYQIVHKGIAFPSIGSLLFKENGLYPDLQLPAIPTVASEFGNIFYFLGHPVQQEIFCLMRQAFSIARLTNNDELTDLTVGMAQWDILELLHHLTVSNGNGSQPRYFAPGRLDNVPTHDILSQLYQLYEHFIQRVTDAYL